MSQTLPPRLSCQGTFTDQNLLLQALARLVKSLINVVAHFRSGACEATTGNFVTGRDTPAPIDDSLADIDQLKLLDNIKGQSASTLLQI